MDAGRRGDGWTTTDEASTAMADGTPEVAFAADVPHRRLDRSDWEDVYVVGDVHGCIAELRALLDRLDPSADDLVVFVGDLVRKGPDSAGVVDLVRSSPNMLSVRGNNEAKLLRGEADCGVGPDDLAGVASMPVCISWPGALVVHGGLDPRAPLRQQGVETLLTARAIPPENGYDGPFWFESYEGPPRVFFGHTVLDEPFVGEHAVGLDTGCVYGGALSAYDCRRDELVSVPANEEYRARADAKIVEPE